jgi:hypothetical protein
MAVTFVFSAVSDARALRAALRRLDGRRPAVVGTAEAPDRSALPLMRQ